MLCERPGSSSRYLKHVEDNRVVFSAVSSHSAVQQLDLFSYLTSEYCATDVYITISSAVGISDHQGVVHSCCMGSHLLVCEGKQRLHVLFVYSDL